MDKLYTHTTFNIFTGLLQRNFTTEKVPTKKGVKSTFQPVKFVIFIKKCRSLMLYKLKVNGIQPRDKFTLTLIVSAAVNSFFKEDESEIEMIYIL